MFTELRHSEKLAAEKVQAQIQLPTLPDVRPFGNELMGEEITFDAHAARVLQPFKVKSDVIYNIDAIEQYLTPYFEQTGVSDDFIADCFGDIAPDMEVDELSDLLPCLAKASMAEIVDKVNDLIRFLPEQYEARFGTPLLSDHDKVTIAMHHDEGNSLCITSSDMMHLYRLYAHKVDAQTRQYLSTVAVEIACRTMITPLPYAMGCHDFLDDYMPVKDIDVPALKAYILSDSFELDTLHSWYEEILKILGKEALSGLMSYFNDMNIESLNMTDLAALGTGDMDCEDDIMEFRAWTQHTLGDALIYLEGEYDRGKINQEFLQELRDFKNTAHCNHPDLIDILLFISEMLLTHLPEYVNYDFTALTDIEDLGVNLLYALEDIDECVLTKNLADEQFRYLSETGEDCYLKLEPSNPDWLHATKALLTGIWLMECLEVFMENY